jgi:hypothetical protein
VEQDGQVDAQKRFTSDRHHRAPIVFIV